MSKKAFVGIMSFLAYFEGQKDSFTSFCQSQHRLRFHWPPPVHRWGALEFDDLESWTSMLDWGKSE